MPLFTKSLSELEEVDLAMLISRGEEEGKTLDYKETLPGNGDEDRKEFLYDVSSFANAAGGYLIFGMQEDNGVPTGLSGISVGDIDAERLRLLQMVQDGIQPRIANIELVGVALANGNRTIVMHIPKSWAMPHMVTFKRSSRFYARNGGGKYQLDVQEIRSAFVGSETAATRIRDFRRDRLALVGADEGAVRLGDGAKVVLHIVPLAAFELGTHYDVINLPGKERLLMPIATHGYNHGYNLDGFFSVEPRRQDEEQGVSAAHGYVQLFRNGCIEVVDTYLLAPYQGKYIPSRYFEDELIASLPPYFNVLRALGSDPPVFLMLSLLGVREYAMGVPNRTLATLRRPRTFDRDVVILPEVLIEHYDGDSSTIFRPIFDAAWNAAGWPRSIYYTEDGSRVQE